MSKQEVMTMIQQLSDEQLQQVGEYITVMFFKTENKKEKKYSFIGIGHSGKSNLSTNVEAILNNGANRREGWESGAMSGLLDTGFLLAVLDEDDKLHSACATTLLRESRPILPDVVLPELAYMVLRELGYQVLIEFLSSLVQGELEIEKSSLHDLERAGELLERYADNRIDFVDCVIAAMAERLHTQRILTVDRRHFQIFRPQHCSYFVIEP